MRHVANIAREPHPMGSSASGEVRQYIVAQLTAMGLEPALQEFEAPDYFGIAGRPVTGVNVMARIPGAESTGALVLMAHYDSVPTTPGANDDASGVAVVLEAARALGQGPPCRNDVILLLTDGEEPAPRYGVSAFVARHPWAGQVRFVVNLEAVGGSGPSILIETSGSDSWLVSEFAAAAEAPLVYSFLTEIVHLIGGSGTDFAPLAKKGVPGLHFAYLRGSPIYHSPADTVDRVSRRSLRHHGSNALAAVRTFGNLDLGRDRPDGRCVYFTIMGRWSTLYPARWTMPLAVLAGLMLACSTACRLRRSGRGLRSVGTGAAVVVGQLLAATVASAVAWKVFTSVRDTPGVIESYVYFLAVLVLSLGLAALAMGAVRNRLSGADHAAGAASVWWLLALATGLWMPGASYLFVWPVIAASLVQFWPDAGRLGGAERWLRPARVATVAGATILLLAPALDVFIQMAQPRPFNTDSQVVALMGVAVALATMGIVLIRPHLIGSTSADAQQSRRTATA